MDGEQDEYIKRYVKFMEDRANEYMKQLVIKKREMELQTLIPEAIKNCKKVNNSELGGEDIKQMLNFCIEIIGVKP